MAPTYVNALLEAQDYTCWYCYHRLPRDVEQQTVRNQPTKDHFEPRCHGGTTTWDNLVMACAQCNQIRGAMNANVFYDVLSYWFAIDDTLHGRWHHITFEEFGKFKAECARIHQVQWHRRLKKCRAARGLHQQVPLPFLAKEVRVY